MKIKSGNNVKQKNNEPYEQLHRTGNAVPSKGKKSIWCTRLAEIKRATKDKKIKMLAPTFQRQISDERLEQFQRIHFAQTTLRDDYVFWETVQLEAAIQKEPPPPQKKKEKERGHAHRSNHGNESTDEKIGLFPRKRFPFSFYFCHGQWWVRVLFFPFRSLRRILAERPKIGKKNDKRKELKSCH